jgi:hypothetical protein
MRNRLLQIAELGKIPAPEIESNGDDRAEAKELYSHLVERIHRIVETNTPAAARGGRQPRR